MSARPVEIQAKIRREAVLAHLEHIFASTAFKASPKLQQILKFLVIETLEGRGSQIKEYTIGVEVYRRTEHDPAHHSTIRMAMNRLRAALNTYYKNGTRGNNLRIEIPSGTYTPVFRESGSSSGPPRDLAACAVLPFRDFRRDNPVSQLADNITDELIHALTYVPGLNVVARTSSFAFRNTPLDVTEVGRRLGVSRILEGSLRLVGAKIELRVGVINAEDGHHIWSGKFSGPPEQILDVQHHMATAVIEVLQPQRSYKEVKRDTPSVAAWRYYRLGRIHAEKRTMDGWAKSIDCYQKALKADPNYVLAHTGIADAHVLLANFGEMRPSKAMSIARRSAETALAHDPMSAEARTSLAAVKLFADWNWAGAEQEFQSALRISPSYAQAHHWYARLLSHHRRTMEAKAEMDAALKLDPVSPGTHMAAGMIALEARAFESAMRHFSDALDIAENHPFALWQTGITLVEMGNPSAGVEWMQRAFAAIPKSVRLWSCLGYGHARAGTSEARQFLKQLYNASTKHYVSPLDIALVHLGLGEKDRALELITSALDERDNLLAWLSAAPYWSDLYDDSRFLAILELIGLPQPK